MIKKGSGKLLNIEDVAEYLGLHVESVRRCVRRGDLPARKVGKRWKFRPEDLDAWYESGITSRKTSNLT